jgi:hypothetical protein
MDDSRRDQACKCLIQVKQHGPAPASRLEIRTGGAFLNELLVWCVINKLNKVPMDFVVRQGVRRVKAGSLRGMPRAGLNARNWLWAGTEGHSSAMATTSNAA